MGMHFSFIQCIISTFDVSHDFRVLSERQKRVLHDFQLQGAMQEERVTVQELVT